MAYALDNDEAVIEEHDGSTPSKRRLDREELNALRSALGLVRSHLKGPSSGVVNLGISGMSPTKTGAENYAALMAAITSAASGAGIAVAGPALYLPLGTYSMSRDVQLKRVVRLFGDGAGQATCPSPILSFPAGSHGIVVNRHNTLDGGVVASTTGADCSIIEGVRLNGAGTVGHGIWLRARAVIRNVLVYGFGGNGIHVVAMFNGDGEYLGNANNFVIDTARVEHSGGHGLYVDGADANAGVVVGLDASLNDGWGIFDSSFLGNTYVGCHTATNGLGAYKADNANARSVFVGCYSESGQPGSEIEGQSLVLGGMHAAGFTTGGMLAASGGNALQAASYSAADAVVTALLCGDGPSQQVLYMKHADDITPFRLRFRDGHLQIVRGNVSTGMIEFTGTSTLYTGGRTSVRPGIALIPETGLAFAGPAGRTITWNTAAPTAGEWGRGDRVLNRDAAPGGKEGWVCTTAGTLTAAWAPSTAYAAGVTRTANGRVYKVTTAGTSAESGGPSGTGTGIVDGSVVWDYFSPVAIFKAFGAIDP